MSKLLVPPVKLIDGMEWKEATNALNQNFDSLASTFRGFSVENVIAFPDNTNSVIIPAGGLSIAVSSAISTTNADDVVFITPQMSVFIDAPAVGLGGTGYDNNYLYPTGASLTVGQLKSVISTYVGISKTTGSTSFVGTDGQTYYYGNDVVIMIRNSDSASHTYYLTLNQAVFTKSNSFYR